MTTLTVVEPGPSALLQDLGRPGLAHLGVPRSGAFDLEALRLANRLVGNDEGAVGVEVLVGGFRCRFDQTVTVALTGGLRLTVDGREAPWGEAVGVPAGAEVGVVAAPGGLRGWLACGGGLRPAMTLGSGSRDTLSGLGPPPLAAGDVVGAGEPGEVPGGAAVPGRWEAECVVRCRPGPRASWFGADGFDRLLASAWTVGAESDRVGVRLEGPRLERAAEHAGAELASEGLVAGAVQVPASGAPLVFAADHPTTGGYPVIGVVDHRDLGRLAQAAPGGVVRFTRA